jgi:hypothetical protein
MRLRWCAYWLRTTCAETRALFQTVRTHPHQLSHQPYQYHRWRGRGRRPAVRDWPGASSGNWRSQAATPPRCLLTRYLLARWRQAVACALQPAASSLLAKRCLTRALPEACRACTATLFGAGRWGCAAQAGLSAQGWAVKNGRERARSAATQESHE